MQTMPPYAKAPLMPRALPSVTPTMPADAPREPNHGDAIIRSADAWYGYYFVQCPIDVVMSLILIRHAPAASASGLMILRQRPPCCAAHATRWPPCQSAIRRFTAPTPAGAFLRHTGLTPPCFIRHAGPWRCHTTCLRHAPAIIIIRPPPIYGAANHGYYFSPAIINWAYDSATRYTLLSRHCRPPGPQREWALAALACRAGWLCSCQRCYMLCPLVIMLIMPAAAAIIIMPPSYAAILSMARY